MQAQRAACHNEGVASDGITVLDRRQLREVTLGDGELMQEILCALIDDTARQIPLLEAAIRERDPLAARRLAHYSKGACANAGACSAAAALENIERMAVRNDFAECGASLNRLAQAIDELRSEIAPE
jgi:HPt (histidine-containing phosphotransfer) domain-containing protein